MSYEWANSLENELFFWYLRNKTHGIFSSSTKIAPVTEIFFFFQGPSPKIILTYKEGHPAVCIIWYDYKRSKHIKYNDNNYPHRKWEMLCNSGVLSFPILKVVFRNKAKITTFYTFWKKKCQERTTNEHSIFVIYAQMNLTIRFLITLQKPC